jgi:hypothetical protein
VNKLTKKCVDDFMPYLKPEYRNEHEVHVAEAVKVYGEIVKIEDTRSADGKDILERTYYHKNGISRTLCSVQAGVASLPA